MNTWSRSAIFAGAALAVLGLAPQAFAQVCVDEAGAAFGLCTAYCEAMDCDSESPQASDTACGKVLAKWNQQTESRPIPCDVAAAAAPICPVPAADVTTICGVLPAGTDYFFAETTGSSGSEDSPGICLCSTTITECAPELLAGDEGACGTDLPFQGSDSISMATSGGGSCDEVCRTIGSRRRCFTICD